MNNILFVNYKYLGNNSDGTASRPFKTVSPALAAMTGSKGGYVLHIAPGVYMENGALEVPSEGLTIHGNGSTLYAKGGITLKGTMRSFEFTLIGTITLDGGTLEPTLEVTQALLDTTIHDLNARQVETLGYGVISGLGVTAQAVPAMTVKVAAGILYMPDGTRYTPTKNDSLAITAADETNPRIDIVYISSAGVVSYLAGTAAATPTAPPVPTGGYVIAEIAVAAEATAVATENITDKRTEISFPLPIIATLAASLSDIKTRFTEGVGYGVYTGLEVAAQTEADMTVKVSDGTIYMSDGTRYAISAVAEIAITAADATNARKDIVYVSAAGAVTYLAGTAAAVPEAPAVPTGGSQLAEIAVAAEATTVIADNITDKRTMLHSA